MSSSAVTHRTALGLNCRFDSGRTIELEAEAFVASWQQTLFYWSGRDASPESCTPLLALTSLSGGEARLRDKKPEENYFPHTGDAVDKNGLLLLPARPLVVRIVDEEDSTVTEFAVTDSGLRFLPGPNVPLRHGGYHRQLLLSDGEGNVLSCCWYNGWHTPAGDDYSGGRGFLLYVADADWLALKSGDFHYGTAPRSRPSALAASRTTQSLDGSRS